MVGQMKTSTTRARRTVARIYALHVSRYPWSFAGVVLFGLVMQGAVLAAPWYMRSLINIIASSQPTPEAVQAAVWMLAIVVGFWLLDWAAHRIQYFSLMYLEVGVIADLYNSSFRYLLGHSYNFFISNFAGSIAHKITKFSKAFETLFDGVFGNIFQTLVFITGAIVVLTQRNEKLGFFLGVWTICFLAFQVWVSRLRQPARIARAEAESRITGNLADAISNQSTIVLFTGNRHEIERFGGTVATWSKALIRTWTADGFIWMGIGLFFMAIEAGLMYVGIGLWQQGLFTVGDFVLVQAYLLTAFERMVMINRELRRMGDAYGDAQELAEILDMTHEVADRHDAKPLAVSDGMIEFRKVGFHFHSEQAIFTDFNLAIRGGEKVALVGPSGAGKSTITKLLLRFFDVKSGSIEIDGQDISEVTQESLREAIAFVPQEPVLFHRSLMENIRYGRRDATDAEVIEAAQKAHCHEFIEKLPQGYETYVGERGVKLSGGERQRVAIARAILKNAPILILDEATSSLDSESEVLIQDALAILMQGKTVIVIAHRLSTIMKMDRILALADGAIVEEGTHDALLAKGGLYSKLWSHQAGGFIADED